MIAILGLTFGFVFFDRNAANFLMPFLRAELRLSYTQVGMLASALALTWAVAGVLGGAISDRTSRRTVPLIIAVIAFSVCSVLSGIAGSFTSLLLARMLMGAAEGPILPISQSLVAAESSEERRGHNMGVMQTVGSAFLGSFVAPILIVALAGEYGWRVAFFLAGVPGLPMAWLIWKYVREPEDDHAPTARDDARAHARVPLIDLFRYANMRLCIVISVAMVAWMVLGWVFLPPYYTAMRGMSPSMMSFQVSVLGLSAAAFAFVVPRLSDRFGRKPMVALFCLVGGLVPIAVMHFHGSAYLLALIVFLGWSASGTFSIFMGTIPSETVPATLVATALGVVMGMGEAVGGVLGPTLAGMVADRHGLEAALAIQGGCAFLAAFLALFLKETAPLANRVGG